ncbi:MAG: DinB family protein [Ignavibacteriaceae bacterium]|nr:DinB family protein [Ignavibacteriaceae bacterium]
MRPNTSDYPPYYQKYIDRVEGDDIIWVLNNQISECLDFLETIPEEKKLYSYAEGKWTIAQLIGHFIDTERIMTFRALWFARNEPVPLPGFDQDNFIKYSNFNRRTLRSFMDEWTHLRKSNIILFESFGEEALHRKGVSNNKEVSVLALLFIIAGHLTHHLAILKERYI